MVRIGNASIANGVVAFPNAANPTPITRETAATTNPAKRESARLRERMGLPVERATSR
jgi:hypothetical protein